MRSWGALGLVASSLVASTSAQGITLDVNDPSSLKSAAKTAAQGLMTYYNGDQPGQVPGLLPKPYYWWEAGGMMGALIAYSTLTGDTQYDQKVKDGLLFQIGDNKNYMPQNQTSDLGNDDQCFWAFAAMDAAEMDFSNPSSEYPSWVALAQAVFNSQAARWDTQHCGGGLRWQIFPFNAGYDYKNTISTGGLFQLAARLARYTGNQTYADWADKTYNWLWDSPIMNQGWYVWDGTSIEDECKTARELFWTYNVGTMIMGSAYMYDYETDASKKGQWQDRLTNLLHNGSSVFFVQSGGANQPAKQPPAGGQIMSEVACEFPEPQTCNYDQPSFKAYTARWLKVTTYLAPFTKDFITPLLQGSAKAAAQACAGNGGPGQNTCGRRWYQNGWDGKEGVGEQMSAMSVFVNNLDGKAPFTQKSGGSSEGNAAAGGDVDDNSILDDPVYTRDMTAGDKAGAGILTALSLLLCGACTAFMVI